jgi:hypothetical protein
MKPALLLKFKRCILALIVLIANFTLLNSHTANAATAGSGNCVQTYSLTGTGDITVSESGGYCYVAFRNTGAVNTQAVFSWTRPTVATSADVLVVGGGGGGGARHGGGGGGGGFVQTNSYSISSASSIAIAVGAGGGASTSYTGTQGQTSYFKPTTGSSYGLIAIGGGYGANGTAGNGGSGGGAGAGQTVGTVTSQTQSTFAGLTIAGISFGNSGKAGASDTNIAGDNNDYWAGGGGGGAGGVGTNPLSSGTEVTSFANNSSGTAVGGSGGAGKSVSWITSTVASNLSVGHTYSGTVYFAGGGGGGMGVDGQGGGVGGLGGGATGTRTDASGNAGSAYTGGGGGGSGFDDINKAGSTVVVNAAQAGAGGSGVVVIRYIYDITAPTITGPSSATGATSSISVAENSTVVHTFTASESVSWSKSGADSSFFAITSAGGVLTISSRNFESAADSDANNSYVVVITATDTIGNAATQTLTVTITDVNEAPTITTNSSGTTHSVTQAENISAVITYAATDVDAGTSLSWSLSGTDAADFSIAGSGALSFASNPDYEAPADSDANNLYIVVVTVSDGSLTDTQTITITITNANENASVNAPTISGTVYKGVISTITVTINVSGKVRFFVGGKRISTCKDSVTSGTYPNNSATCLWKPPVTGKQILTATLTPTDNTFAASTSAATEVLVRKRGTVR